MDERPALACCQLVEPDVLETDAALFDCDTCAVAQALADLWPENVVAWTFFHRLSSRLVRDTHLAGELLRSYTADWDPDAIADLIDRLALVHDVLVPVKQDTAHA